jgi:hypothetical protein
MQKNQKRQTIFYFKTETRIHCNKSGSGSKPHNARFRTDTLQSLSRTVAHKQRHKEAMQKNQKRETIVYFKTEIRINCNKSGPGSEPHNARSRTDTLQSMLRIRDVYPGSRILIFSHPVSRIQQQTTIKRMGKKSSLTTKGLWLENCLKVLKEENVEGHELLLVSLSQAGMVALQDSLKDQQLVGY